MIKTKPLYFAVLLIVVYWLMGTPYFSMPAHNIVTAEHETLGEENMIIEQNGNNRSPEMKAQENMDSSLRDAVTRFIEAADQGDIAKIDSIYDPEFMCVRVADEGGFVRLTREQMIAFWKNALGKNVGGQLVTHSMPTQKTTIHHSEVVGDTGFVLLTRIKNIGNGWEPMFYNLVWKRQGNNWRLLREFVHQKSIPKQNLK